MCGFSFNKIVVFESLDEDEKKTGTEIYNDLFYYKSLEIEQLSSEIVSITNKDKLICELEKIALACKNDGLLPILHFEMHGLENHSGLYIISGESISWEELCDYLRKINILMRNNLFFTMAVCHGAYLMKTIDLRKAAPFWGFIGSFDVLYDTMLLRSYRAFYEEFLYSFDMNRAIMALQQKAKELNLQFPNESSYYNFINCQIVFRRLNEKQKQMNEDDVALNERFEKESALMGVTQNKRKIKRLYKKKSQSKKYINEWFKGKADVFFMINRYPENKERFKEIIKKS